MKSGSRSDPQTEPYKTSYRCVQSAPVRLRGTALGQALRNSLTQPARIIIAQKGSPRHRYNPRWGRRSVHSYFPEILLSQKPRGAVKGQHNITKGKTSDGRKLNKEKRNPRELFYLKHFSGKFCRGKLSVKS